jgi:hypothetical protein
MLTLEDQATVDLVGQQHDVAVLGFPIYESMINFLVRSLISLAKFSSTFPASGMIQSQLREKRSVLKVVAVRLTRSYR